MSLRNSIGIYKKIFLPHVTPLLGRWKLNNSEETTLKIKYANEDHCGVCSSISVEAPPKKKVDETEYIYFMGFESVHE
jgi:hypothetical protein